MPFSFANRPVGSFTSIEPSAWVPSSWLTFSTSGLWPPAVGLVVPALNRGSNPPTGQVPPFGPEPTAKESVSVTGAVPDHGVKVAVAV